MIRIIPNGEGKAKLTRNKRGGLRLKVCIDPSHIGSFCARCCLGKGEMFDDSCVDGCKEFERVTGTRRFWFERNS
jgi:hypothetical protein